MTRPVPPLLALAAPLALALSVTVPLALTPAPAAAQDAQVVEALAFAAQHPGFADYWYQGLAELDRYELEQSRYGGIHPGEAVLVYVTEEFDNSAQVKWDHGPRDNVVPIFKLNAYRRFYTGVYPYTLLTSVFAPVHGGNPNPLKLSASTQEWCGHTYVQVNRRGGGQYLVQAHSYFQGEADQQLALPEVTTEDELFVRVRRAPETLPVGTMDVLPALHALRLLHLPIEPSPASGTLEEVPSSPHGGTPARLYTLAYAELGRTVRIWFEPQFPFRILAWEEEQADPGESDGGPPPILTTRAVLTHSIMLDYWNRHGVDDAGWRELLGLTM
jgi:hypothetical protein